MTPRCENDRQEKPNKELNPKRPAFMIQIEHRHFASQTDNEHEHTAFTPADSPASDSKRHPKWFSAYAVGSSSLILILVGVLIFNHPASKTESISDLKERTAAYEIQGKAQTALLEKQRVAAEQEASRRVTEAKRRAALARIEGLEGQAAVLRQSLAATETEKAAYSTKITDYAMDHKAAILAMGITVASGIVVTDKTNNLTDNQKTAATISGLISGGYALYNYKECMEVADQMAKAATMQATYDSRIAKTRQQLSSLQSQIADERKQLE